MAAFTHLALDTSALIASGWPFPSADLANTVVGCKQLGIPVLMPRVVLEEARAVWVRKTLEKLKTLRASVRDITERAPGLIEDSIVWPDRESVEAIYDAQIQALQGSWNWTEIGVPSVSLEEAVRKSISHDPPFAEEDSGFRDALIIWSLLDQLKASDVLAIVAVDNAFSTQRMEIATKARGVSFKAFRVQTAWEVTEGAIRESSSAEVLAMWEATNSRLVAALEKDRAGLQTFVQENLEIPETATGVSGHIQAVREIRVLKTTSAHAGLATLTGDDNANAYVALKLEVILSKYEIPPPRRMRAGQRVEEVSPITGFRSTSITEIDGIAYVTLRVHWPPSQDDLPKCEYVSVEFRTEEEEELRRKAKVAALEKLMKKS